MGDAMKAAVYRANGPAKDVLQVTEMPQRAPGPGEVCVAVHASGVNPSDVKSRAGRPLAFGHVIPHSDGAGVITAVGADVPAERIGRRVWLWNGQWGRPDGTAAEAITLPSAQAVDLPDDVPFDVGACAGIPLLTAVQAVFYAQAAGARTVLVTGAGSSVGHYITQLAQRAGMTVIGSASSRRAQAVRAAGAAHVVDYRSPDFAEAIIAANDGPVDAIIDMDFSSTTALLGQGVLRPHGTVVCYGSNDMGAVPVPFRDLLFNSWALQFFVVYELTHAQRQAALAEATRVLQTGALDTLIDSTFPLDQIVAAHHRVESGQAQGNVILSIV